MNSVLKIKYTLDALFGQGVSKYLPKDVIINYSKKTGRIKHVYQNDILLCTLRTDGGLAITPFFAQILLKSKKFKENCLEVDDESKAFVQEGSSVFCKHVTWCGKNIMIGGDVSVLHDGKVIAVGKAVLSTRMIKSFKKGVAVKIRDSLKSTNSGV
ncbi:PUA domain-containing protein [Candidatus Nitrosotalea okcheonensis]|nr:PUA domain-containing protein [Candidatus Nitrosotalea okcheonensis]MDE1727959.1 queuine tRNA-ribosyltransferase [Nitrososphaerota archaeon]MDE1830947.1 queuine tRNA-ribosyltransferase [Nitrososphaerota archaeon]MDE1841365.1 queuine tRNA-ribosyltransferase [Nitrososphaerota archaeon]MDE1877797.1 queuine tRNA-ribosyltransferase [Nitrososphaerota archaeon]